MEHTHIGYAAYLNVLSQVDSSIKAEQVFCSIVTEMTFLPHFKDQTDLKIIHKENYETSYHRNTAAGNLLRLVTDEDNEMLILMTVECFIEARNHDKTAGAALDKIVAIDPEEDMWVAEAAKWHKRRRHDLNRAAKFFYKIIGPELWEKGAKLAE